MGGVCCTDCDSAIALPSDASAEMEFDHAPLIRWRQVISGRSVNN
jgi:hypothetical protein